MAVPTLTPRTVGEILHHEGLVREAYRDSAGVWTWSVGITSASGHRVERYRDNPQSIARCLEVFVWLLTTRYLPAVLAAFGAYVPQEHQLAAALSFHWNTGAIARAAWLKRFLAGDPGARDAFLDWRRPPEILPRRRAERALFFDGEWAGDGTVLVYEVAKPSYRPVDPTRVEIGPTLKGLLPAASPDRCEALKPRGPPASSVETWFDRLFD
jgi:lysozyme